MIQVTPQMRILLAVEPVDFRKGIDGLASVCKNVLGSDPFCGYMFVFMNKKKTAIKILVYDGQGFWLCQKIPSVIFWLDSNSLGSKSCNMVPGFSPQLQSAVASVLS
jgi:hypothetical protein